MVHNIEINSSDSSEYIETGTEFKVVKVTNLKFPDFEDSTILQFKWIFGRLGGYFKIPISGHRAKQQDTFDIIEMAKNFDEPFTGPFQKLDISIENEFNKKGSKITFDLELKC